MIRLWLAAALAALASTAAAATPSAYDCRGEVTEYNDGRSEAQWYASRREWTGRLWLDRSARTWRIEEPTRPPPFPETIRAWGGGPAVGRSSMSEGLPFVEDRRGVSLRDFPTEEVGRFTPRSGRLQLPDRGRTGLIATCRAAAVR